MNIYDTKTVLCSKCEKCIGKVEYDAEILRPHCSQCANPMPEGDTILYTISAMQNQSKK